MEGQFAFFFLRAHYVQTNPFPSHKIYLYHLNLIWLVVLTILKNIGQWEGVSHILWKIKHVCNHQPVFKKPF